MKSYSPSVGSVLESMRSRPHTAPLCTPSSMEAPASSPISPITSSTGSSRISQLGSIDATLLSCFTSARPSSSSSAARAFNALEYVNRILFALFEPASCRRRRLAHFASSSLAKASLALKETPSRRWRRPEGGSSSCTIHPSCPNAQRVTSSGLTAPMDARVARGAPKPNPAECNVRAIAKTIYDSTV